MPKLKLLKEESGQAMVLAALIFVVLFGVAGLVIDFGNVAFQKSNLQNAADAAALAGAKDLPNTSAISTAVTCAHQNGLKATANGIKQSGDTVTATTPYKGDSTKIEVKCSRTVPYVLARFLGFTETDVSVRAVAQQAGGLPAAFGYAIFSASEDIPLSVGKNNDTVTGSIHTNNALAINGNNNTVTGAAEGRLGVTVNEKKNDIGVINGSADNITIPAAFTDELLAKVRSAPIHKKGNQVFNGNNLDLNSSIYVEGNVLIHGNNFTGKGFIYATGNITLDGNNISMGSATDAVFIYSEKNITISGNNLDMTGIIYAPNGIIDIQKNNWNIKGRVIADSFSGDCLKNNFDITAGTVELGGLPSGIGIVQLTE